MEGDRLGNTFAFEPGRASTAAQCPTLDALDSIESSVSLQERGTLGVSMQRPSSSAHLGGLPVEAFTNLSPEETGIEGVVLWMAPCSRRRPRLWVVPGAALTSDSLTRATAVVTLDEPIQVLGMLPETFDREPLISFARRNRDVLLRHCRGELGSRRTLEQLEPNAPISPPPAAPFKPMTTAQAEPLPFWGGEKCYACDCTKVIGFRDRRPEGHDLEVACERHADPTIEVFEACKYCQRPVRQGHRVIDGEFVHQTCHAQVEAGTFFAGPPAPRNDGLPKSIVVGFDGGPSKLRTVIEQVVDGVGEVVAVRQYAPDEGGGWTAVLGNEYAALKVFYKYRLCRVNLDVTPAGWVVSLRPQI